MAKKQPKPSTSVDRLLIDCEQPVDRLLIDSHRESKNVNSELIDLKEQKLSEEVRILKIRADRAAGEVVDAVMAAEQAASQWRVFLQAWAAGLDHVSAQVAGGTASQIRSALGAHMDECCAKAGLANEG
jgi:hypothetical protein